MNGTRSGSTWKRGLGLGRLSAALFGLALLEGGNVRAQELDPAIYLLVDTSGSMLMTTDGSANTYGDGSNEHPHDGGLVSRFYMAKEAIATVLSAYGEVRWGLARFQQLSGRNYLCSCSSEIPNNVAGCAGLGGLWHSQDACRLCDLMADVPDYDLPAPYDRVCINYAGGLMAGCTDPISGNPLTGADILVPLGPDTEGQILLWINHNETDFGEAGYNASLPPEQQPDPELRANGGTPIGGSLQDLYTQLSQTDIGNDSRRGCRPYSVIVLTDGAESCNTDPVAAAAQLRSTPDLQRDCGAGCPTHSWCSGSRCRYDVKTYVIAFAVAPNEVVNCNEIAVAGGTGGAIQADNESDIVSAMADIIASSIQTELCNDQDDDCDSLTDEDFPEKGQPCDNGLLGQCFCSGTYICSADGSGTICDYAASSPVNPCSDPAYGFGSEANFGCDGLDNDCDGYTDEGQNCGTPPPEMCNGIDDDNDPATLDGEDDPAVGQPCGSSLGICSPGLTACVNGVIECQGGTPPGTEDCNGLDDNCDGVVDGLSRVCYTPGDGNGCDYDVQTDTWTCEGQCATGISICPALANPDPTNTWGPCLAEVGPGTELCDDIDNDCDGLTDENLSEQCYPPGSGQGSGCTYDSGNNTWTCEGECMAGTRDCVNGVWQACAGYVSPTLEQCDNLDNDCDGSTDEPQDIPGLGQPCGLALGRCTPGTLECINGVEICQGGTGPFEGECNGLDDDCDGQIDELDEIQDEIGQPCGTSEGVCEPGITECLGGQLVCSGGVQPTNELCDNLDNDCDGLTDNDAYCPPNSWCYMGGCRVPCQGGEFSCPAPLECRRVTVDGIERDLCVPSGVECGGVFCPEGWVCESDVCVDPCDPDPCEDWQQCVMGACHDASCTSGLVFCDAGQFCYGHQCVPDPCFTSECDLINEYCVRECMAPDSCEAVCVPICTCAEDQICNDQHQCVADPCAGVECDYGQVCVDGGCMADPCHEVFCNLGEMCIEGNCVPSPCQTARCPAHTHCEVYTDSSGEKMPFCVPNEGTWISAGDPTTLTTTGSGGGCTAAGTTPSLSWALLALAALFVLAAGRRRKKRLIGRSALPVLLIALLVASAVGISGCKVGKYTIEGNGRWDLPDGFVPFPEAGVGTDASAPDACVASDEICDGLDNDCDELTDEDFDLTSNPLHCGQCNHACEYANAFGVCNNSQCEMGDCLPGFYDNNNDDSDGCEYSCLPTNNGVESCDNIDNDCDGQTDEDFDLMTDPDNCGVCHRVCAFFQGQGTCNQGNCELGSCNAGYADKDGDPNNGCECLISSTTDDCDGVDNDCDNQTDEDAPVGSACYIHPSGCTEVTPGVYTCVGACAAGQMTCVNGMYGCTGQQGPVGESCNYVDDDCNGTTDDGFDLNTDMANCGQCGLSCFATTPTNAYTTGCVAGNCQFACLPGYVDLNSDLSQGQAGNGCEYACQQTAPAGTEYCDGVDNDCDGLTDEPANLVPPPVNLCKTQAGTPCENTTVSCEDPDGAGPLVHGWYCQYPAGVETNPNNPNLVVTNETLCDDFDGNCDGNTDESFVPAKGTPCDDGQLGVCRGTGAYDCNTAQTGTECVITSPGQTPQQELCDTVDNDCDGLTDESVANPGTNPSYVQDDVVTVVVGTRMVRVFQYEASRPSATPSSAGSGSNVRACSRPGVIPWSRVTYEQARQACQKAGMALCSDLDWTEACDGQGTDWEYPYHATTYNPNTCNGADAGFGAVRPTGSLTSCDSEGYDIHDLSGNLREWTTQVVGYTESGKAIYAVRGGSYTDMAEGLKCDFESSALVEDAFTANVGFRCCSRCGNGGSPEPGEQCDDGNRINGDGCSAVCGPDTCGNGTVEAGEQCDCGTNPANLPGGCIDINGGPASNCAVNCQRPPERCSSLYPEDQDNGGEANDCADPDCAGTWCGDVTDDDGDGFSEQDGDCDDGNPNIHPAADEVCNNGVDDNCNGETDNAEHDKDGDGELRCVGGVVNDCDDWNPNVSPALIELCPDGLDNNCDGITDGNCATPCEIAAFENSYIGCEYWPTPTVNSQLDSAFNNNFGVVVYNANASSTLVSITRGGAPVASQNVAAGQLYTFTLPINTGLKLTFDAEQTVKVANAAYRLTSTLPVTVYQFNPLDYELNVSCQDVLPPPPPPPCYSYTNDAALLMPTHVLTNNYIVMARQTYGVERLGWGRYLFSPGFMAIVGTQNGTTVTVTYSAYTQAGDVAQSSPGQVRNYTLQQGEVLQVISRIPTSCAAGTETSDNCNGVGSICWYCDMGADYDLTGTIIQSDAPVAVFGGHNCSFVPFNFWACDHLEQQMYPLEAWGQNYVVARTEPQSPNAGNPEPNVIRILSGKDNNQIDFVPAQPLGGSITLDQGEWAEFLSGDNFTVRGSEAVLVGQYLVGQNYYTNNTNYWGDPAFALAVPTEQYRNDYSFLVPSSMTYNWLNIIKPVGIGAPTVYLDGNPIPEASFSGAIGDSYFGVVRINISSAPYSHVVTSSQPFGIMVYGFARYTSYFYPGGLDLNFINSVQ